MYDLEERTTVFAQNVIRLLKKISQDSINKRLIEQCVGSSGSIGANYCEANESESKKDFIHKLRISKKEIRETKYWLRLLATTNESHITEFRILWKEADELMKIFATIVKKTNKDHIHESFEH